MHAANLIPASRRQARTTRSRLRLWSAVGGAYAVIVLSATTGAQLFLGAQFHNAAADLDTENAHIKQLMTESVNVRKQLAEAVELRENIREVTDQPDWSIILAALPSFSGDETLLSEVKLHPAEPKVVTVSTTKQPAKPPAIARRYSLAIKGISKSQPAVARFVMALQQSDIFEEVKLVRTGREPFLSEVAVSFELECTMGDTR